MTRHPRPATRLAVFVAVVASLALGHAASAQTGRNFLWKVQGATGVMYLAGSVHLLPADAYPLPAPYQRAFEASDTLVEEIDLNQARVLSAAPSILMKGMYADGRTLDRVLAKDTLALVNARLKNTLLPAEMFQSMKPWMVMLMLETMAAQQAGLDATLGLDQHFYERAVAAKKTVIGLETAESQMDRLDRMPEAMQEQMLRATLEELDTAQKAFAALVAAWRRGDGSAIERTVMSSLQKYPAAYNSLIVERNRNWMPQLDKCLAQAKPCFVVVGAAHLVGPDGLLKMLQQKGYRLEQQ